MRDGEAGRGFPQIPGSVHRRVLASTQCAGGLVGGGGEPLQGVAGLFGRDHWIFVRLRVGHACSQDMRGGYMQLLSSQFGALHGRASQITCGFNEVSIAGAVGVGQMRAFAHQVVEDGGVWVTVAR